MATWNFDPNHSSASFAARHMMISTVRGTFNNVNGKLEYDPNNPNASYVEAVIDVKQMSSTGIDQRDQHLLSPDFLWAEKYPTITFKSTKVEANADGTEAKVYGQLTIRDITREVVLDVVKLGEGKSPYGVTVIGFEASTKINREDFGLTWNMALETGGWLVGKEVKIDLAIEAVPVSEAQPA